MPLKIGLLFYASMPAIMLSVLHTWASSTKHKTDSSTSYHNMQPSHNYVPYVRENLAAKKGGHLVRKEWS